MNDNHGVIPLGVVTPSEAVLAELQCDFVELLWQQGEAIPHVRVTNWSNSSPVMISKGTVIGTVEEVTPNKSRRPCVERALDIIRFGSMEMSKSPK